MNLAYLELKLSWQLHSCAPEALPTGEQARLRVVARRQEVLESRILGSAEAMCAAVPEAAVRERLATLRQRYETTDEMHADLVRLGMDEGTLEEAVVRDLLIESVLDRAASAAAPVSETEAEIFYHLHPARFTRPETRELRHILLTFDDEAERRAAFATLSRLRLELRDARAFAEAALRHSQCPTALDGGRLGHVRRGQLFPPVEAAAFSAAPGTNAPVVQSEMGWHLVRCEAVAPECRLPFAAVRTRVIERLSEVRREQAQRAWINGLPARSAAPGAASPS